MESARLVGTDDLPPQQRGAADGPRSAWPDHTVLSLFVFLWAGNFVLAELALREMTPIAFSAVRLIAGGASMLLLLHLQTRFDARRGRRAVADFRTVQRHDWPRLLLVSLLLTVLELHLARPLVA
jgi:hypothetical protein